MSTVKRNPINELSFRPDGVGARHEQTDKAAGQGGYLDICTNLRFQKKIAPDDARFLELKEIGLAKHWLDVASVIGIDNFLAMWAIMSDCESVQAEKHYAYVPRYSVWIRYQRNRFIMSLHADNFPATEIRQRIKKDLGESISIEHIKRIIAKAQRQ